MQSVLSEVEGQFQRLDCARREALNLKIIFPSHRVSHFYNSESGL